VTCAGKNLPWLASSNGHFLKALWAKYANQYQIFAAYNFPAITYESGDETGREQIENAAVVFAEEMMRVMLESTLD